jgi:hypothetical protein
VYRFSLLVYAEIFAVGSGREAEADETRSNDVEGRKVITALYEVRQDTSDLDETSRPPMDEEERYCIFDLAGSMDEMHVVSTEALYLNLCSILRDFIQGCFSSAPVESVVPVVNEALDV